MQWDIDATLTLVEKHFGRAQRVAANVCIQSANQRVRYGEFHYFSIKHELQAFEATLGERELFEVSMTDGPEGDEYLAFMDRVGAHAVACVQSIHAMEDLLSASVYRCLNLDTLGTALAEHQLRLSETVGRLKKQPRYATVQALLEGLQLNASFAHVDALSNKAKHSAIVRPWIRQTLAATDPLHFYFEGFERRGIPYPQVTFRDVLAPAFDFAGKTQVDIGNELTSLLT